ncbi:MAG TPA: nitroreductase family protein [Candidatus Binataceae bacterium]|nr:nitroreductase family protein [Candidatus Binataceae bacterium]
MDALEAILSRRVIRSFATTPVEVDQLEKIADAGRHAMSARNRQPWRFVAIRDRARLKEIGALCATGKFVADAPAAIVVLKDAENAGWAGVDCAHAVQNMANAAWAMGIGTCWVGHFEGTKIAAMLKVPAGWEVFTVLPFGYPDPKNPPQSKPLKPRSEILHYERFGNRTP